MDLEDKIREYLDLNGIYYSERAKSFTLDCPNCGKNKLDIAKEEGNYICYSCSDSTKGYAPEPILAELTGDPEYEVRKFIRGFQSLKDFDPAAFLKEKPKLIKEQYEPEDKHLPWSCIPINDSKAKEGLDYLENQRGIPEFLATELGIMYNPKYKQVVFPVFSGKDYVGYQGRAIYGKLKYNDVEKSKHLMFENTINSNAVILAEGPISAMKFAKTGIGFVATMGKAVSEKQMDRLSTLGVEVIYLGLDRDAHKEIISFYDKWHSKFKIYWLEVPSHRDDFGDCTFDECVDLFKSAVRLNKMIFVPDIM